MKKNFNPFIIDGFQVEGQCRDNSYYIRFTDEDIEELAKYTFDLGYALEPEIMATDPEHPVRFKIISKANSDLYGWVSKVVENIDGGWQDSFLYGFYRHGSFRNILLLPSVRNAYVQVKRVFMETLIEMAGIFLFCTDNEIILL